MIRSIIVMLSLAAMTALAQSKVAIIDLERAVINTAEIKKAQAELETKFRPRQTELAKLEGELQQIQTQLQSGKLTEAQGADLQAQGQRKQRDLQRKSEDLQADVDRERTDILSRSSGRMNEVVKKLAEEKGLDVVVFAAGTAFFKPAMDITGEATAAYDKAYPAK